MKLIISLLIVLVITSFATSAYTLRHNHDIQTQLDVLDDRVQFSNTVRYHNEDYYLFRLEKTGFVNHENHEIYSPVYMTNQDMAEVANEYLVQEIERIRAEEEQWRSKGALK